MSLGDRLSREVADHVADGDKCYAQHPGFRVRCQLPDKHVSSAVDWHEAVSTTDTDQDCGDHTIQIRQIETVRWRPHSFEIRHPGGDKP